MRISRFTHRLYWQDRNFMFVGRFVGKATSVGPSRRGRPMRGRRPSPLSIDSHDCAILQEVARSETLPWYQVRRARTILAIAAGQRTADVASHLECDGGT